jgi:hypothetical protein
LKYGTAVFYCPIGVLMPEELSWLMAQPHKQLALGQALSNIVAAADMHPMTKSSLDLMLNRWTFTFGAFGRIYNTAIPSAYTRCDALDALEQYEAVHVLGGILHRPWHWPASQRLMGSLLDYVLQAS